MIGKSKHTSEYLANSSVTYSQNWHTFKNYICRYIRNFVVYMIMFLSPALTCWQLFVQENVGTPHMSYRTLHSRSAHTFVKMARVSLLPEGCNVATWQHIWRVARVSNQEAVRWGERADEVTGWKLLIQLRICELQCENAEAICLPGITFDERLLLAKSDHHKEFRRVCSYSTSVTTRSAKNPAHFVWTGRERHWTCVCPCVHLQSL